MCPLPVANQPPLPPRHHPCASLCPLQVLNEFPGLCKDLVDPPLAADGSGEPLYTRLGATSIPATRSFKVIQEFPVAGVWRCGEVWRCVCPPAT